MTRESLEAFRQTFTVQAKAMDEAARQLLIRTARDGTARILAEQTARGGVAPTVTSYANHPGNANLDSVVLPGPIVSVFDYRSEVVQVALDMLVKASPRQSGTYIANHLVFANGAQVAPEALSKIVAAAQIMIANAVPYARRIEIGVTESGRAFVLQVPNRIYERTAKKLSARFGNVASITFGYTSLSNAYATKGGLASHYTARGGTRRRRHQKAGSEVQAPAIFIRPLAAGKAV